MVSVLLNPTLEHYTSYKSSNLRTCVRALQELQHNTSNCPLNAIREKYGQQKVHEFAVWIPCMPHSNEARQNTNFQVKSWLSFLSMCKS